MISVILSASPEAKAMAKEAGFVEQTVLVRQESCQSTEENKQQIERSIFQFKPYQFLVSDYWGVSVED